MTAKISYGSICHGWSTDEGLVQVTKAVAEGEAGSAKGTEIFI